MSFRIFQSFIRGCGGKIVESLFIHSLYWEKGLAIVVVQGIEGLK